MKRKWIILIIMIVLLLSLSIGSYAYFILVLNREATGTVQNNANTVELTKENFEEVIHQHNTEVQEFNTKNQVAATRYNLKLASNLTITMQHDLLILFDCNLDLNGSTIDLNGNHMMMKHSFSGVSRICNGTITNNLTESSSKLYIDTPNAFVKPENLILNNIVTNNDDVSVNSTMLLNAALNFAFSNIAHHNLRESLVEDYDQIAHINTSGCNFTHVDTNHEENCVYTYDDLDLIDHYYQYDVSFTYTSSNEDVLSSTGKYFKTGSTLLTITATYKGVTSTPMYVNVHAIESAEEKTDAAKFALLQYLSRYYVEANDNYRFSSNIMLPARDSYFDCVYHYDVYNGTTKLDSDGPNSVYLKRNDHFVLMNISNAITSCVIHVSENPKADDTDIYQTDPVTIAIDASGSHATLDNTNIASNILNHYYSGRIVVKDLTNENYAITPNTLLTLDEVKEDYGIQTISKLEYSLVNDNEGTYKIDESTHSLVVVGRVATNNEPNELQNISVKVTFTFTEGTPETVTKYIPIKYTKEGEGGSDSIVSSFRPYYLYYDRYIESTTKGYTYQDFYIPFVLKENYPLFILSPRIYKEDDPNKNPITELADLLKIYIVKINNDNTIEHINNDQYTASYFYENGTTKNKTLPDGLGNTKIAWYIDIDQTKIPDYNIVLELTYYYCLTQNSNFTTNEGMISEFTIPGILRCGEGQAFDDANLYQEIFKIYHRGEEYKENVTYLVVDRVQRNLGNISIEGTHYKNGILDFSITETNQTQYTSFKGLQYLKSLEGLNLSGYTNLVTLYTDQAPAIPAIEYISGMESLKYLNLSHTGLTDRKTIFTNNDRNTAFPGNDNQFLKTLSQLEFLEELYLNDNQIYSFSALNDFKNLKKVDISNNTFAANFKIQFIIEINLSTIFTRIVNTTYGTNGVTNISTFMALKNKGVTVEGYVESADSLEKNIILALTNIEYQDKIGTNDPIENAYKGLSKTLSDYGINGTYPINVDRVTITQTNVALNFVSEEGADEFKLVLTYSYNASYLGNNTTFDVTFEVIHYVERQ